MTTNNVFLCLAVIAFAGLPSTLWAQVKVEPDQQEVAAVVDRFMDAWNHHDAKAFAAVFAEDADFTNWRGTGASGRSKIEEFHAPMFATIFKNSHQTYTPHGHASAWSLIFKDRSLQAHNLAIGTLVAHQQQ